MSLYPVTAPSGTLFDDDPAAAHETFRALSAIPELPALVTRSISTRDDDPRVLDALLRIAAARPKELAQFPELAVAIALVFDQKPPEAWPHPNVKYDAIPVGDSDPAKRFEFYVASQRDGKLMIDPRSLTVRELTFVVDTPVELRELAYVQQIELGNISKLEGIFRALSYDHPRIASKSYGWKGGSYRLIDIGKKGGICMDHAYFVSHAGKAKGIPTVLFTGQGRSGGHAWLGFLTSRGKWNFDVAKGGDEGYPTGNGFDPQTWRRFTDTQMEYGIRGQSDSPSAARAALILGWAAMNADQPFYLDLLRTAQAATPRSFEAWELHAEHLEKSKADPKAQKAFWQRYVKNFAGERDMKARGQRALLRVLRELGDDSAADRLGKQIISENKSKRFDLGIAVAADTVFAKQKAGEWEDAAKEFERVMKRFKRDAGGHLFYNLVQPYVNACVSEGRPAEARAALAITGEILKPNPGSILDNDFTALREQVQ